MLRDKVRKEKVKTNENKATKVEREKKINQEWKYSLREKRNRRKEEVNTTRRTVVMRRSRRDMKELNFFEVMWRWEDKWKTYKITVKSIKFYMDFCLMHYEKSLPRGKWHGKHSCWKMGNKKSCQWELNGDH